MLFSPDHRSEGVTVSSFGGVINMKENDMLGNFVLVNGGTFRMGSKNDEEGRWESELRHTVKVDSFWIKTTPVTVCEWSYVFNEVYETSRANYPKTEVSWDDCQDFIGKLNQKYCVSGFRLPTEAEWEYAAKGGHMMRFTKKGRYVNRYKYSGSDNLCKVGWYGDNSGNRIHKVAELKPNELGIYDMSGNVWEWCQDKWNDNYQDAPTNGSAWETGNSSRRVIRGGCCYGIARNCRSAYRDSDSTGERYDSVGFRLVFVS